ncbi:MAG: histidine kinase dimerization/phospho-acceptor domain-containing protein, partial [candidate division Zixibacteria bacterium]|nr:histidine kinase dimerization/phospho-acceptor domain-containing protein [candidate division Zixibacteria bacterium]
FVDKDVDLSALQQLCVQIGDSSKTRITVMQLNGFVVADSEQDPDKMDNHSFREEMKNALEGNIGHSIRYSNTLQRSMIYLAIPLKHDSKILGVLRLSVTSESIDEALNKLLVRISLAILVVALLVAIIAIFLSKKISQPIEELRIGAKRFAQGDFKQRLPIPESKEIAQLAEAMNSMASELDKRIKVITQQRNEQKAILQSMIEGVVAIDNSEKIIIMNSAAGNLFSINSDQAQGKSVYEVIRNPELQDIIQKTSQSNKHHEGELTLNLEKEKFINYNSSILKESSGKSNGTLLVINDLTRLRHLENIRQDLVANVSHELRTPITSIKGFVETLSEGALDNKEEAHRFLAIIDKQVNRLNAIIEDLLLLSSIEQSNDKNEILLSDKSVFEVITSAIDICQHKANSKNIILSVECDNKLRGKFNAPLMEQALVNLIDNAIKYSPNDSQVIVKSSINNNQLEISVHDKGNGIDKKHFSRLFERFYVIDQARSRELGGTGLGLAIVKHIAVANCGSVRVESELGVGSVFIINISINS